jgi:hypothetical protein
MAAGRGGAGRGGAGRGGAGRGGAGRCHASIKLAVLCAAGHGLIALWWRLVPLGWCCHRGVGPCNPHIARCGAAAQGHVVPPLAGDDLRRLRSFLEAHAAGSAL